MNFQSGLDRILTEPLPQLLGRRFGLLFNQASLCVDGRYACDALDAAYPRRLSALFSPQHGIWGEEQANMIETVHGRYKPLRLPLYSLYSETRQPTDSMLADIDVLVIDLQDVGTRVYTFIWTMLKCLESCAASGTDVIVLDRPNPLGGRVTEGAILEDAYQSFVGLAAIPMRHGLTIGELARWFVHTYAIDVQLDVISMRGWHRADRFPACGRRWVLPSPNMPTYQTTCVYPGSVLFEGTNLSEGRGTTIPFEVVGAPYIDERLLADRLNQQRLPGVRFRPIRFRPTFDKWQGQSCRGVFIDVLDDEQFRSYQTALHILHAVRAAHADQFAWLAPPYEYEQIKSPIDILTGSNNVRTTIDTGCDVETLGELSRTEETWSTEVQEFWLY